MADPPATAEAAAARVWPPDPQAYEQTLLGRIDRRWLDNVHVRRALAIGLLVVLVVPAVQFVDRIGRTEPTPWREGGQRHKTALGRWLPTAALLTRPEETTNPYGFGHWFPLPPFVLLTLAPLSKLGYTAAAVVWAAAKVGGFLAVMGFLLYALRRRGLTMPTGVLLMAAAFGLRPVIADLQHGNVNTFMLIWIAGCWAAWLLRRDTLAGVLLALAIVTKITPALLLVYFAWKRQWRLCLAAGVTLVLVFFVIPGLVLGFARNWHLLTSWFEMLIAPYALHGYVSLGIENQSLYGLIMRLGGISGTIPTDLMSLDEAMKAGMPFMGRPDALHWRLLRPAISLAFVLSLAWLCRTPGRQRIDIRLWLELALVLVAMLLLSERTWKHHGTTLVLVYLGVWYALTHVRWPDRTRALFVASLILQWVLLVGTSSGFVGSTIADFLLFLGMFTRGLLLCYVTSALMIAGIPRLATPPEAEPAR